jgi:FAD synthetase
LDGVLLAKVVMAFGSFDIIHLGHIHYLEKAKELGDVLVVVVSRDSTIERLKQRKPFFDERSRLRMVAALKVVDKAVLGREVSNREAMYEILKKYKPNVIALGYDQMFDEQALERWLHENGIVAKIVRIDTSLDVNIYKSTRIRNLLS